MEHNLDDPLNLESAIEVDFPEPRSVEEVEVLQCNEQLMEFEDQSLLMETGSEEVIVSDIIDDQYSLNSEYEITNEEVCETVMEEHLDDEGLESQEMSHTETITDEMDVQQEHVEEVESKYIVTSAPNVIKVQKSAYRETASLPWQVPIAPKPLQLKATFPGGKHLTLAPKPVKPKPISTSIKKIPLSALMKANTSGQTLLAQIGKQLVVVPSGSQKLKIVQNSGGSFVKSEGDQVKTQLIRTSNMGPSAKPVLAKVFVHGDGPAVLKMIPPAAQQQQGKIVVQSKAGQTTQLLSMQPKGKQVITTQKILPANNTVAKKVLIPANPQAMMIKSVTSKPAQVKTTQNNIINVTSGPPQTRLHQVHLPGKGVQYIRLVTKPAVKTEIQDNEGPAHTSAEASKNYVLTDNKGNIVQMTSMDNTNTSGQFVLNQKSNKAMPTKKLVKIAPITQNVVQLRPSQSLLAPITQGSDNEEAREQENVEDESKETLHELLRKAQEARQQDERRDHSRTLYDDIENTMENEQDERRDHSRTLFDDIENSMENEQEAALKKLLDDELLIQKANEELASRPRKPCNCTKSQCLKLYCECFANGEFCKNCNCNNCHNNLKHEDVRRSAIMGCLDRNPDAFRPKIGKATSTGGPLAIRRHNKGCNCKRSGCLKNYCECYEAKIACSANCKCVGCRNIEDGGRRPPATSHAVPTLTPLLPGKQPCTLMTSEVIEAACQCLLAAASPDPTSEETTDSVICVLTEFARCLQEIIASAQQAKISDSLL